MARFEFETLVKVVDKAGRALDRGSKVSVNVRDNMGVLGSNAGRKALQDAIKRQHGVDVPLNKLGTHLKKR